MRKVLVCALALGGFAGSAQAADLSLDSLKDPLPDTLTWHGVTVYGTIDVGYAYQTNGVPLNGAFPGGLQYQAFNTTRNLTGQSISTLAESGLEQSKIGIKIEENIGYGLTAIGKLETGFNPLSGELADACASMVRNSQLPASKQTANGDSSRCGQAFNGPAYAGISSAAYGTLTAGRQQSLQLDALTSYDPMGLSFAFSQLGYSGFNGGAGSTEAARWDNSVKYVIQYGPVHAAGMYSSGGPDTGILGNAYGANAGVTYGGFSLDAVYQRETGAINLRDGQDNIGTPGALQAYSSNDESWNVMGKYTFDFGGGFKDEGPGALVTFYGGYSHITKSPSSLTSNTSEGGYPIIEAVTLTSPLVYDYEWAGAKYQTGPWSFTGAYYHISQNGSGALGVIGAPGKFANCFGSTVGLGPKNLLCAGDFNEASFVIDYAFNKHFDVYGGVNYSQVANGLAYGNPGTPNAGPGSVSGMGNSKDETTVMTGMRLKF